MNPRLLALMVGGAAAVVGGIRIIAYAPDKDTTPAMLIDAGMPADTTPRVVACWTRDDDAGYREFVATVAVAKTANADGSRDTVWPRATIPFRAAVAHEAANCRVTNTLTWAAVLDAGFERVAQEVQPSCSCWQVDAGPCNLADGGPVRLATTLDPGEGTGPGCIPKVCGEMAGFNSMPEGCR